MNIVTLRVELVMNNKTELEILMIELNHSTCPKPGVDIVRVSEFGLHSIRISVISYIRIFHASTSSTPSTSSSLTALASRK
jgi:hypothetical protein